MVFFVHSEPHSSSTLPLGSDRVYVSETVLFVEQTRSAQFDRKECERTRPERRVLLATAWHPGFAHVTNDNCRRREY